MKRLYIYILMIFVIFSLTFSHQDPQNEISLSEYLTIVVDAEYIISHGWGHVFKCVVKEVRNGELEDEEISLSVFGTYGNSDMYGGFFKVGESYEDLILFFYEDETAMAGFTDKSGTKRALGPMLIMYVEEWDELMEKALGDVK